MGNSLVPHRRELHQKVDHSLDMIDQIIINKGEQVEKGDLQNTFLEENEKDLLTLMIESEKRGEGAMSNEELKLAVNPDIQQRAREKAIRILDDEPVDILPTLEQTKEFVYINQVIKEKLRIAGPTSCIDEHEATKDTVLSSTPIPKGTNEVADLFGIHNSKKVWENLSKFDPERFAQDGEEPNHSMSWVPFSSDTRQCIGMNFSLYEHRVLLSMLLRKYTWTLPENSIHKHDAVTAELMVVGPVNLELDFEKRY
ncbi:cytochrome P450 [Gilbertella persicaria]|uniref:cytochrome P450 n=1 Tax=Gilbertella persicaria TaxID=101096 RepID=UPI002220B825|nr:cytochrome P450 [Gilbertella persicaria]KAI8054964.1 cytochrome P450 [Gilbertella persicaria]